MKCPKCGGEPIGRIIRGVYDGVLFWSCADCGHAWQRDVHKGSRREHVAQTYITAHNAK